MHPRSLMVVPLIARGQLLGALTFLSAAPSFVEPRADSGSSCRQIFPRFLPIAIGSSRFSRTWSAMP
jgi:hypothetical protein